MKKITVLFLLFCITIVTAQEKEDHVATLYFKDGKSIVGFAKLRMLSDTPYTMLGRDVIYFRLNEEDEYDKWRSDAVDKITLHGLDWIKTYQYINLFGKNRLCELVCEGAVNLYRVEDSGLTYPVRNDPFKTTPNLTSTETYYLKRTDQPKFTKIGKNNRKKILKYLNDCSYVEEYLEGKSYNVFVLKEVVDFYNYNCID